MEGFPLRIGSRRHWHGMLCSLQDDDLIGNMFINWRKDRKLLRFIIYRDGQPPEGSQSQSLLILRVNSLIDVGRNLLDTRAELQPFDDAGRDDAILNLQVLITEKLTVNLSTGHIVIW